MTPTQAPTRQPGKLDHRQVEKLIRYGMSELEKAAMSFRGEDGRTHFARFSPGKLGGKARDILRAHPLEAEERFAEYIAAVIRDERSSYKLAELARRSAA